MAPPGQEHLLNKEILTLLSKVAIAKDHLIQAEDGFFLTMLLVLKKEGNHRSVINLRSLNRFLRVFHPKVEGVHIVRDLLWEKD